jgi:hypothetical protein
MHFEPLTGFCVEESFDEQYFELVAVFNQVTIDKVRIYKRVDLVHSKFTNIFQVRFMRTYEYHMPTNCCLYPKHIL